MSALAWGTMLLGLACVPLLDPPSSRYLRATGRARRVRRLRKSVTPQAPGQHALERAHLEQLIAQERNNQLHTYSHNPSQAHKAGVRAAGHLAALTKLVNEAKSTPIPPPQTEPQGWRQ